MSLHFDLFLACDLKPDVPEHVLNAIKGAVGDKDYLPSDNPEDHWQNLLCYEDQYTTLFPGGVHSFFSRVSSPSKPGEERFRYTLSFRVFELDDVVYEEHYQFLVWLAKYSETEGFVGYLREEMS